MVNLTNRHFQVRFLEIDRTSRTRLASGPGVWTFSVRLHHIRHGISNFILFQAFYQFILIIVRWSLCALLCEEFQHDNAVATQTHTQQQKCKYQPISDAQCEWTIISLKK